MQFLALIIFGIRTNVDLTQSVGNKRLSNGSSVLILQKLKLEVIAILLIEMIIFCHNKFYRKMHIFRVEVG